jgi:predicted mannosyl-3-phosphoglycerate phosphatase (HAD superfamily)
MTTEERLLRLENAFTTLSELAAKSNERHDSADDRLDKLLTLALSADERMSQQQAWINELGAEQVRLARAQADLTAAQGHLAAAQAELAAAQARTEAALAETNERLNNLINVVERFISEGRNGKP